jgi:hypothetical protein
MVDFVLQSGGGALHERPSIVFFILCVGGLGFLDDFHCIAMAKRDTWRMSSARSGWSIFCWREDKKICLSLSFSSGYDGWTDDG